MTKSNIFEIDTLKSITKDLKGRGLTIGITHGAFDLFHFAHLDLLKTASSVCDFLIVGIDSDENVRSYKGENRPINNELVRIETVASILHVGAAFLLPDTVNPEYYSQLYRSLCIDYVFIGRSFGFADIIEQQAKNGGAKLIKVQTQQIGTTSSQIEKIVGKYISDKPGKTDRLTPQVSNSINKAKEIHKV
jgi:cytidyltransferase-like protein